jgi:hypothetical protein
MVDYEIGLKVNVINSGFSVMTPMTHRRSLKSVLQNEVLYKSVFGLYLSVYIYTRAADRAEQTEQQHSHTAAQKA